MINAIKTNDVLHINVIRRYQWHRINFNDIVWKDEEILEACYRNGYDDIADFLKTIHDFNNIEPSSTWVSFCYDCFNCKKPEIREFKTIDLSETESNSTNEVMIERKERYRLFSRIEDYKLKKYEYNNTEHLLNGETNYFWTIRIIDESLIFFDAIKNNDKELVYLLEKYICRHLNFHDEIWKDPKFLATCHENGFDEIVAKARA